MHWEERPKKYLGGVPPADYVAFFNFARRFKYRGVEYSMQRRTLS